MTVEKELSMKRETNLNLSEAEEKRKELTGIDLLMKIMSMFLRGVSKMKENFK
jgi:hypothetical protein